MRVISRGTNVLVAAILAAGVLISCDGDDAPVEDRVSKTPVRTARTEAEKLHDVEARLTALRDRMEEAMRQTSGRADRLRGRAAARANRLERGRRRLAREVEEIEGLLRGVKTSSRARDQARLQMLEQLATRLAAQIREIKSRR